MGFWSDLKKSGSKIASDVGSGRILYNPQALNPFTGGFGGDEDIGTKIDKTLISGDWDAKRKAREAEERTKSENKTLQENLINEQARRGQQYFGNERERIAQMGRVDDRYLTGTERTLQQFGGSMSRAEDAYQADLNRARDVENQNMTRASNTYTSMNPMYREAMDTARNNARFAMTLNDYMDPNNQVAASTRNLYNQEGEGSFQRYEQQAQNEQRQGLANYGVMSSLGAQAAANAMGGQGPMTVGQQMASMATANQAAAEGYANTQRRLQALRDQGMTNREALRQLGLNKGFERTDKAYEAGRLAKEDAARRMGEYEGFQDRDIGRRSGISQRLTSIEGDRLGSQTRQAEVSRTIGQAMNDLLRGVDMDKISRETGLSKAELEYMNNITGLRSGRADINLGMDLGTISGKLADINSQLERNKGAVTGVAGVVTDVLGSIYGGGQKPGNPSMGAGGQQTVQGGQQPAQYAGAGYTPMQVSYAPAPNYGYGYGYGAPYGQQGGFANYPMRPTVGSY